MSHKIYICSAYKNQVNPCYLWLKNAAKLDHKGKFTLIENPDEADIILFCERDPQPFDYYHFKVLSSSLYKKYREKCVLYSDGDRPISLMPMLSPSFEKKYFNKKINISAPYISRDYVNKPINKILTPPKKKYLFSFIGRVESHDSRAKIMRLTSENAYLKDTSKLRSWELKGNKKEKYIESYKSVSLESKFILCPRGEGANSYRLYETMKHGISPVIISDDWVPMKGPDWEKFSIRVSEKNIDKIPEILKNIETSHEKMGEIAYENWEKWIKEDVCFHNIASMGYQLLSNDEKLTTVEKLSLYLQFLRPFHFRNLLRTLKNRFTANKKRNTNS